MVEDRIDYAGDAVTAAHAVMVELMELLAPFQDSIVLVGGWVPELLLATPATPHLGSVDVDLALNLARLGGARQDTLVLTLRGSGYRPSKRPFTLERVIEIDGHAVVVDVDFLSAPQPDDPRTREPPAATSLPTLPANGCELAFALNEARELRGRRPDGQPGAVQVRVAGIVPFLVMKGLALGGPAHRYRRKDAYDVYYCVDVYPGGGAALAELCRPHLGIPVVWEGLAGIRRQFTSAWTTGPIYVVDIEGVRDPAARDMRERDVFEKVDAFLTRLGID